MKLSVVIAAYDERDNIEEVTRRLDAVLRGIPGIESEVIFVVEGRDGTWEILERLRAELGGIQILYTERSSGLGNAFQRGFGAVAPDAHLVVTMDADLNHRPEEIPRLLEEIERRDLDVLIGSRFVAGSQNEGIPAWKWLLSIMMNRLIASLFDLEIRDKTSGFRIYRAEALRRLRGFKNKNFAFLPEMLIEAKKAGLRIGEAPIHFTFRTRGQSKMAIAQTSRSYLVLLHSQFDGWSLAALGFLLLGISVRLLYAFPVHKYGADADSLLSGIRAFDILGGKLRVFYSYVRIGALESYMHAIAFSILGPSRVAVSLAPLLAGTLTLVFFFFLVGELMGRQVACLALLVFALPSPSYIAWTYMPNGYPETMLFCVSTLYFAARIARVGFQPLSTISFGLCAGLGFWTSLQTLSCTIPAVLWLAVRRRKQILAQRSTVLMFVGSFAFGALPWILYNVRYGLPSLRQNFAAEPARDMTAVLSNVKYFFTYNAKELTVGMRPLLDGKAQNAIETTLRLPAAGVYILGCASLLVFPFLPRRNRNAAWKEPPRSSLVLLWLVAGTVMLLYVFSKPGEVRGLTVRYVLPLFPVLAAALGLLAYGTWRRSRIFGAVLLSIVLGFNLADYEFPWTRDRTYWRTRATYDAEVTQFLEREHVRWVCGNYWIVYPLVFVSQGRILGLPFQRDHDHYGYAGKLPAQPVHWALVALDPNWLRSWVARANLRGHAVTVGEGYHVFLPDRAEEQARSPGKTLALLQDTAPWGH